MVLLLLTQTAASTLAGLHGNWHRHHSALRASAASSTAIVRWQHGDAPASSHADEHAQLHARGETHDHAPLDASVLPWSLDSASEAMAQLAAALAPGADAAWSPLGSASHVRASGAQWVATHRFVAPAPQPPRG